MDWTEWKGWKQMLETVKEQWRKLADDDRTQFKGRREQLGGEEA